MLGWGMAVSRRSRRDFGITALGGAAAIFALVSVSAHAEPVEEFFSGRQIKFVVGSAGGGGYESYSRLLIPYLSRPLPGHPLFVLQEMPGAAGMVAANYLYNIARHVASGIGIVCRRVGSRTRRDPQGGEPAHLT